MKVVGMTVIARIMRPLGVVAVLAASAYAFLFTWVVLAAINAFTPVIVRAEHEEVGLDESLHGEVAYA